MGGSLYRIINQNLRLFSKYERHQTLHFGWLTTNLNPVTLNAAHPEGDINTHSV